MVATNRVPGTATVALVVTPYAPLSLWATVLILVLICTPIMAVSVVSGLLGSWYALPASAATCVFLCLAFRAGYRRTQRREIITVVDDAVSIERGHRFRESSSHLPRSRAYVLLQDSLAGAREQLFLCAAEERIEVGEFLEDKERHELADALRDLIGASRTRDGLLTA